MGLAERRAMSEYQEKSFPAVKQKIDAAAGFPVEMDIHWDTMTIPDKSSADYVEIFDQVYFTPLTNALKAVAMDEMGKKAVQAGLKKVVVDGSQGISASSFKFEAGVLTVQHEPYCNLSDVVPRTKGIQKLLEEKL